MIKKKTKKEKMKEKIDGQIVRQAYMEVNKDLVKMKMMKEIMEQGNRNEKSPSYIGFRRTKWN